MDLRNATFETSPTDSTVTMALLVLALYSVVTILERGWVTWRALTCTERVVHKARAVIERADWTELARLVVLPTVRRAPAASALGAGLATWLARPTSGSDRVLAWLAARTTMARVSEEAMGEIRRGQRALLVIAWVAPLGAILGCLVGIINALAGVPVSAPGSWAAVSAGLGQALVLPTFGTAIAFVALLGWALLAATAERLELDTSALVQRALSRMAVAAEE